MWLCFELCESAGEFLVVWVYMCIVHGCVLGYLCVQVHNGMCIGCLFFWMCGYSLDRACMWAYGCMGILWPEGPF